MGADCYATIGITDEDHAYRGSLYSEVRDAIFANPYRPVHDGGEFPYEDTTVRDVLAGLIPYGKARAFRASVRTVESGADLRWGLDRKGCKRVVHRFGVCMTGLWEIDADTPYTGYFRKGSKALIVARHSIAAGPLHRGALRAQAIAGKLYPTDNPNHTEPLPTANFFLIDDLATAPTRYLNDIEFLNAPQISFLNNPSAWSLMAATGACFRAADGDPSQRQIYPIGELRGPADPPIQAPFSPKYMRLKMADGQPRIEGDDIDVRNEILSLIFDKNDPTPKRKIVFNIDVANEMKERLGRRGKVREFSEWQPIGRITFDNAVVSHNGDWVLHFQHPKWRDDLK